jgi:hypothetical protein
VRVLLPPKVVYGTMKKYIQMNGLIGVVMRGVKVLLHKSVI